jgi:hypothetical protein
MSFFIYNFTFHFSHLNFIISFSFIKISNKLSIYFFMVSFYSIVLWYIEAKEWRKYIVNRKMRTSQTSPYVHNKVFQDFNTIMHVFYNIPQNENMQMI